MRFAFTFAFPEREVAKSSPSRYLPGSSAAGWRGPAVQEPGTLKSGIRTSKNPKMVFMKTFENVISSNKNIFLGFLGFLKNLKNIFLFFRPGAGNALFFEIFTGRPGPGRPGAVFAPAPTGIGLDFS